MLLSAGDPGFFYRFSKRVLDMEYLLYCLYTFKYTVAASLLVTVTVPAAHSCTVHQQSTLCTRIAQHLTAVYNT